MWKKLKAWWNRPPAMLPGRTLTREERLEALYRPWADWVS